MAEPGNDCPPDYVSLDTDEDLDFEIVFYERILKQVPDSIDILMALGNNYTQRGLVEKGLSVDERLCRLRATDPIVRYNLACTYSLLGRVDDAIQTLEQSVSLGYRDCTHLQRDPDLEGIRCDPRYLALLDRVQRQQLAT